MSDLRINETCSCGASVSVLGSRYRRDHDARNPRGAEEVIERWREDHKHIAAALVAAGVAPQAESASPQTRNSAQSASARLLSLGTRTRCSPASSAAGMTATTQP